MLRVQLLGWLLGQLLGLLLGQLLRQLLGLLLGQLLGLVLWALMRVVWLGLLRLALQQVRLVHVLPLMLAQMWPLARRGAGTTGTQARLRVTAKNAHAAPEVVARHKHRLGPPAWCTRLGHKHVLPHVHDQVLKAGEGAPAECHGGGRFISIFG
jgi:hypothetical protein